MNDRRTFLVGSALLVLVVLAAGAMWALGGPQESPAGVAGAADASVEGQPSQAVDPAREPIPLDHPTAIPMSVYMTPQCGCCGFWVEHMEEHGFEVEVHHRADMGEVKRSFGIPMALASCHTAVVNGYLVEGHVPGEDVRRFLAEGPEARGLAVPGMPVGSPGMEVEGGRVDSYQVLLFTSDGQTGVFARHGGSQD